MPVPLKKYRRAQKKLLNGQQVLHFVEQRFEPVGFCDHRGDPGAMGVGVGNGVFVQREKNDLRWRMSLIHNVRRMHFERGSYDEPNHFVVIYD
jgi:hypothetical protein